MSTRHGFGLTARILGSLAVFATLLLGPLPSATLRAQDLEPRFMSPAPVGMNFALAGYAYSRGNVLLDAALPLEDTDARLHAISLAYARSIGVFGLSGLVSAVVPLANGTWYGELEGVDTSTTRNGVGDPLVMFAVNFIGAPAMRGADFASYRAKTILGASLKVRVPIGQYNSSKFFNLSTGRWVFSPRLGLAHYVGRFGFEGYVSAWFFTTNRNFFGGNTVAQDPFVGAQIHVSYLFRRGFWGALSFGQGFGGTTTVNGQQNDDEQRNNRLGATLAFPITRQHSLKAAYTAGVTTRAGADFDTFVIAWQYRWGGKR